jgi:hypothetical protein
MAGFISFHLQEGRAPRTAQIRERMRGPLPRPVTSAMADTARRGPGSAEDQFRHQAEMAMNASFPWKRTLAFGSRPAPRRTLHDKGALEAAWTGRGAGSVTRHGPNGVTIGVDSRVFPQARMLQRAGITFIRVTPKSRLYLGLAFGVWLRKSTRHIKVQGRRVSMNRTILGRARKPVSRYYLHGETASRKAA